jgi:hypothetical protein
MLLTPVEIFSTFRIKKSDSELDTVRVSEKEMPGTLDAVNKIGESIDEKKPLGWLRVSRPPIGTLNKGVKEITIDALTLLTTRSTWGISKIRSCIKADEMA